MICEPGFSGRRVATLITVIMSWLFGVVVVGGAAPLVNGGFESPVLQPRSALYPESGSTALVGWSIEGGRLTLVRGLVTSPKEGNQFIVFNDGDTPSGVSIKQSITTVPGRRYKITYSVGRTGPGVGDGNVSVVTSVRSQSADVLAQAMVVPTGEGFGPVRELDFIATSGSSTLQFSDSSAATVSIDLLLDAVSVLEFPVILQQPQALVVMTGESATLSVEASGVPMPSYQWLKNGTPIAGATSRTLHFSSAAAATAGSYSVIVANSLGTVVSSSVVVGVTPRVVLPVFTLQPTSQQVLAGSAVVLSAVATGVPAPAIQWLKNGTVIAGATTPSLAIASVSSADAGSYYAIAANDAGAVVSSTAKLTVLPTSVLANLSVRSALAANRTFIVGGVVSGGSKQILVRAAGPALNKFGLTGFSNPRLEIFSGSQIVGFNDNWPSGLATTFSRVGAFAFDVGSEDAAILQALAGAFTVHISGVGAGSVLVEAYDVDSGVARRMTNLSARTWVGSGADILIAGFSVSGSGSKQLLIRAVGPSLTQFGVVGALSDPKIGLYSSSGVLIQENDDWTPSLRRTFDEAGAFSLPSASSDAAILVTVSAGTSYTVQVSGKNTESGEALVEIYEIF